MKKLVYNDTDRLSVHMKEGTTVRNIKEAEERKKEILDVAEELFATKGYDSASTTDILERIGIARGTLYYHFKSKEEILDALIERTIQGVLQKAKAVLSSDMPALYKLIAFVGSLNVDTDIGNEIADQAHKPQNALMHQKIQGSLLSAVTPMAAEIIREGIREGCFSTDYPEEAAEMLLIYSSIVFDGMNEIPQAQQAKKTAGFVFNMERLLGIHQGALADVIPYIH